MDVKSALIENNRSHCNKWVQCLGNCSLAFSPCPSRRCNRFKRLEGCDRYALYNPGFNFSQNFNKITIGTIGNIGRFPKK